MHTLLRERRSQPTKVALVCTLKSHKYIRCFSFLERCAQPLRNLFYQWWINARGIDKKPQTAQWFKFRRKAILFLAIEVGLPGRTRFTCRGQRPIWADSSTSLAWSVFIERGRSLYNFALSWVWWSRGSCLGWDRHFPAAQFQLPSFWWWWFPCRLRHLLRWSGATRVVIGMRHWFWFSSKRFCRQIFLSLRWGYHAYGRRYER